MGTPASQMGQMPGQSGFGQPIGGQSSGFGQSGLGQSGFGQSGFGQTQPAPAPGGFTPGFGQTPQLPPTQVQQQP